MRWIRDELLPHCGRFPGPKSVIIMDNASFHCHPEVATAIEEAGCEVRYLPSYSPTSIQSSSALASKRRGSGGILTVYGLHSM